MQIGDASGQRDFDTLHLIVDINTPPDRKVTSSAEALNVFLEYSKGKEAAIYKGLTQVAYESI
ncbi:hypothetical protein D3C86_1938570 [compost metagenome]